MMAITTLYLPSINTASISSSDSNEMTFQRKAPPASPPHTLCNFLHLRGPVENLPCHQVTHAATQRCFCVTLALSLSLILILKGEKFQQLSPGLPLCSVQDVSSEVHSASENPTWCRKRDVPLRPLQDTTSKNAHRCPSAHTCHHLFNGVQRPVQVKVCFVFKQSLNPFCEMLPSLSE